MKTITMKRKSNRKEWLAASLWGAIGVLVTWGMVHTLVESLRMMGNS